MITPKLPCVDWTSLRGPWNDSLMFIFDMRARDPTRWTRSRSLITSSTLSRSAHSTKRGIAYAYVWSRVEAALHALETSRVAYLPDGGAV